VLEVAQVLNGDTTWVTYTKQQPCAVSLATSVLSDPILSSAPIQSWAALGAVVAEDYADSCVITFSVVVNTVTYDYRITVDKVHWVQTSLQISGGLVYSAVYVYAYHEGIPVLRKVALGGDTTMALGGIEFGEIRVNGILGVKPRVEARRAPLSAGHSRSAVIVVTALGRVARYGAVSAAYDLAGRWSRVVPLLPGVRIVGADAGTGAAGARSAR
jgi:hypothetical protein